MPSHSSHSSRPSTFRAPRWGAPVLPSFCCCWRSATPWGLALFSHHSASRIFITQPGCSPPPAVTQDDDRRPRGGEERARPWSPPCPHLQGCSSSVLGRRVRRVGARLHVGRWPASSSNIRGRRASSSPAEEASSSHAGEGELLLPGQGAAIRPPSERRSCRAQVAAVAGAEVVVAASEASSAEAVASADETVSATCARGLRLFVFNGWFSSPVRGREQGPFSSSVCPEAIAAAV
jgi:hypothetical protein